MGHPAGETYHTYHKQCLFQADAANSQVGCPECKLPHDFSHLPESLSEKAHRVLEIFHRTAQKTLSLFGSYLLEGLPWSLLSFVIVVCELPITASAIGGLFVGTVGGLLICSAIQAFVGDFLHLLAERAIQKLPPNTHAIFRIGLKVLSALSSILLTYFLSTRLFVQAANYLDNRLASRAVETFSAGENFAIASLVGTILGGIGTLCASCSILVNRIVQASGEGH